LQGYFFAQIQVCTLIIPYSAADPAGMLFR
jgi:hypothetical protein